MKVLLFGTCLVDIFFPEAGEATVRLLRRFGAEPVFPKGQTCCGQPAFNAGYEAPARAAAAHFLWEFDGDDPIVTPSGSCAAMVKHHYLRLFRDDPKRFEKAKRAGDRIYELTQCAGAGGGTVTHEHDPRHGAQPHRRHRAHPGDRRARPGEARHH
ncbi:MAG: (Fe-S)-binding protein, partial [Candidatus Deferrimicrobium sp.]